MLLCFSASFQGLGRCKRLRIHWKHVGFLSLSSSALRFNLPKDCRFSALSEVAKRSDQRENVFQSTLDQVHPRWIIGQFFWQSDLFHKHPIIDPNFNAATRRYADAIELVEEG